jgi:hypothetical protein
VIVIIPEKDPMWLSHSLCPSPGHMMLFFLVSTSPALTSNEFESISIKQFRRFEAMVRYVPFENDLTSILKKLLALFVTVSFL